MGMHSSRSTQQLPINTRRTRLPLFTLRNYSAPSFLFKILVIFAIFSLAAIILVKLDDLASQITSQTKTIVGHNLKPTPWHHFPPKVHSGNKYTKASKHIKCSSFLSCSSSINNVPVLEQVSRNNNNSSITAAITCPSFFRWIHEDLGPWTESRISVRKLMEAQRHAAFRVVIVKGRLYVDFYYDCVQTRAMFTLWGLLQLLKRYPGMVPDVDLMFDCMDKPFVNRGRYRPGSKSWPPPPLFRYCTTEAHFDVPFPDWSFWGWPETNIEPWDEEFKSIKQGSQAQTWEEKFPYAYWKGNPDVGSAVRTKLLQCNDTKKWGAQIFRQNWLLEEKEGYKQSKLANQCKNRYKVYAEGSAWSVSLKYIVSCASTSLFISSRYEDFFTRGLIPRENYWPVSPGNNLCRSIKFAVDWGNSNPSEAEAIGKSGQNLMEKLPMERVYDYMYHLINEYAKLQDFKLSVPSSAREVCEGSVLCYADEKQKQFLERSAALLSPSPPCTLQPSDHNLIDSWIQKKNKVIREVQNLEKKV